MTKFMQPSFSVFNNYDPTPICVCGERIKVGYSSQEGYLCSRCYFNQKQKKAEARIKALIKEGG